MKNKIIIVSFLLIIYLLCILNVFTKKEEISYSERRKLSDLPSIKEDNYSDKLEKYLLDHFIARDSFRKLKAVYNYKILNKIENNDIVLDNKTVYKIEYPTNYKSVDNYYSYVDEMSSYFNKDSKKYLIIVPDKNYYQNKYIKMDYKFIYEYDIDINKIDIRNMLNIEDYYDTDLHWKQEKLDKIVKIICKNLDLPYKEIEYKYNSYDKFYGIYYGESAIINKPEKITYLTNDVIENSKVTYLENKELNKVYNIDKLKSFDSYEIYLDGSSSFIEIENNNSLTDRELIMFRDSFGSSITPLLIPYYKKITLIDNRYISSKYFIDKVNKSNQDIIFLNSTLLVNKSNTLKG